MLQTNPMTPTKTLAASGTHSFMKAASPGPLPSSPLHSHQYAAPGLWEVRNEADMAEHQQLRRLVLPPLRSEQCQRGEGRGRKLKPHLRRLTGVLSSQQLVLHAVSIELVCCMECPFSRFSCISDLHGNGWSSSAAAGCSPAPSPSGRPGMHWWDETCPGGILRLIEALL